MQTLSYYKVDVSNRASANEATVRISYLMKGVIPYTGFVRFPLGALRGACV